VRLKLGRTSPNIHGDCTVLTGLEELAGFTINFLPSTCVSLCQSVVLEAVRYLYSMLYQFRPFNANLPCIGSTSTAVLASSRFRILGGDFQIALRVQALNRRQIRALRGKLIYSTWSPGLE
jgi:hypothetical protein